MSDLLLDAKLNQASYDNAYRNGGTGAIVAGWQPVAVTGWKTSNQLTTNFSAQLFKEANGTYKLAYRGTSNWGAGDVAINNALAMGYWSDEMTDAIKFTYAAIQAIQAETGKTFDAARRLLAVTGHSQGGSEAELAAKFFGLAGTSLDGPGVLAQVPSQAWNQFKAELMRQQPDLQANYTLTGFLARRYTFAVGSIGSHLSDVQ